MATASVEAVVVGVVAQIPEKQNKNNRLLNPRSLHSYVDRFTSYKVSPSGFSLSVSETRPLSVDKQKLFGNRKYF